MLFHPIEHAIISHYLGVEPPPAAQGVNIWEQIEPNPDQDDLDQSYPTKGPVRLRYNTGNEELDDELPPLDEWSVANAVGRLLVGPIRHRLPLWPDVEPCEQVIPAPRAVIPLSRHLLTVNWGHFQFPDGGPRLSFPESYTLGYLPGYHRYVVVSSNPGPGHYRHADNAVGHFSADEDVQQGVQGVIVAWWKDADRVRKGRPWSGVLQAGAVSEANARAWAREVWPAAA